MWFIKCGGLLPSATVKQITGTLASDEPASSIIHTKNSNFSNDNKGELPLWSLSAQQRRLLALQGETRPIA